MAKKSAGVLAYRRTKESGVEVFLVHPGGPYWAKKDIGSWTIPKGEFDEEDPLDAAVREFAEETGQSVSGDFIPLPMVKQPSGKVIYAFLVEAEPDVTKIQSNTFEIEWPPKSGSRQSFPEVDKAEWFTVREAHAKIIKGQRPILEALVTELGIEISVDSEPQQESLFPSRN